MEAIESGAGSGENGRTLNDRLRANLENSDQRMVDMDETICPPLGRRLFPARVSARHGGRDQSRARPP